MSIDHAILKITAERAEGCTTLAAQVDKEIADLERQLTQKRERRDLLRGATARLGSFEVEYRGYHQCPACWIERGERSPLQARTGSKIEDVFDCRTCDTRFSIPIQF